MKKISIMMVLAVMAVAFVSSCKSDGDTEVDSTQMNEAPAKEGSEDAPPEEGFVTEEDESAGTSETSANDSGETAQDTTTQASAE